MDERPKESSGKPSGGITSDHYTASAKPMPRPPHNATSSYVLRGITTSKNAIGKIPLCGQPQQERHPLSHTAGRPKMGRHVGDVTLSLSGWTSIGVSLRITTFLTPTKGVNAKVIRDMAGD